MSFLNKIRTSLASANRERRENEAPAVVERRTHNRINAVAGTKMLVIDDSKTVCSLLKKMLVQNQYDVSIALDGETGLKMVEELRPDLIFLDIVLPNMNGFQVLRTLRKSPLTENIPIIMISGNAQATEKYYAERIGADDFMKKPFSRYEVFHRLESFINQEKRIQRSR